MLFKCTFYLATLRANWPNTDFFCFAFSCSAFSHIWTEYGDLLHKSPYSVQMPENTDKKSSVFGQFFHSEDPLIKNI